MKIPRDISGKELIKLLAKYGYEITNNEVATLRLQLK